MYNSVATEFQRFRPVFRQLHMPFLLTMIHFSLRVQEFNLSNFLPDSPMKHTAMSLSTSQPPTSLMSISVSSNASHLQPFASDSSRDSILGKLDVSIVDQYFDCRVCIHLMVDKILLLQLKINFYLNSCNLLLINLFDFRIFKIYWFIHR